MGKRNQWGINNPTYRHGRYIRVTDACIFCKSLTTRLKCSTLAFCNTGCKGEWQKTNLKGKSNPNFNKKHPHMNIGRVYSEKTKEKFRNSQIKYIEKQRNNGLPIHPTIGKHETPILDNLEKCLGYTIERQYKVAGYFIDGYCPMLKLAIEIDEPRHLKEEHLKRDIERQTIIENTLGCQFLRININK